MEYIIVGDTKEFNDCLVFTCGTSYEHAEEILDRILNNPTENEKRVMKGHKNLRIETVSDDECWWNGNCD